MEIFVECVVIINMVYSVHFAEEEQEKKKKIERETI